VTGPRPAPTFEIAGADTVAPDRLHAAFTAAFADYLAGPIRLPPAHWPGFLARQGIDLAQSRVALAGAEPLAFCLVAPRPDCDSWRLGTMGALPAARGTGIAPSLLDDFITRATTAGAASVELECFARNTRALRLYQGRGFETVDELHGYQRSGPAPDGVHGTPASVDLQDAFDWLDACRDGGCELPMQITPAALRAASAPLQAWRHRQAQVVVSRQDDRIAVHSLVDRGVAQQDATELMAALLAGHPGCTVHVPQLQRHALGGAALERLGFTRLPLHQLWMRRAC
jgi:ribosomal protein S18 acetylase RimI-like enzyme